jgi:hypothetical protein
LVTRLPNPGDGSQTLLGTRVGRLGWEAGVPTLMQFSADAYNNEMALTTQSCFRGTTVNTFALENTPNALPGAGIDGCDDPAPRQPAQTNPGGLTAEQWAQVDDPVGSCAWRTHRDPGRRGPLHGVHDRARSRAA